MGDIRESSRVEDYLATSSSDELLDPPITQVVSENKTKSDGDNSDDKVIPAFYPPNISTSI
jgi:hypothetical protein